MPNPSPISKLNNHKAITRVGVKFIILMLGFFNVQGQDDEAYLKANAIKIDNVAKLSDSIYAMLSGFQIITVGEIHGTNESAPFVYGLTDLFTNKGDSVLVGLEIPPTLMAKYTLLHTDSSIFQSEFFNNPPFIDGKESYPWATLIAMLNNNPKVKIFFYDVNAGEGKVYERDSLMAQKIKVQHTNNTKWRVITLSGNYHNSITNQTAMTAVLKRNIEAKVCSLNMEYKEGSANANFGNGIEVKRLGSYPSIFNSTAGYDRYLLLYSPQANYDYNGIYFTKYITAAKMTTAK
jgi:hypothetical protein